MKSLKEKSKEYSANYRMSYNVTPNPENTYHMESAYITGATEALNSQWRSVEQELPEDGVYVLLSDGFGRFMGYYDVADGRWYGSGIGVVVNICYWMPVPELPNKNKK